MGYVNTPTATRICRYHSWEWYLLIETGWITMSVNYGWALMGLVGYRP